MRISTLFTLALAAIMFAPAVQAAPIQPQPVPPVRNASGQIDFFTVSATSDRIFISRGPVHSVPALYRDARIESEILAGAHTLSPFLRSGAVSLANVADTPTQSPEPPSLLLLGTGILGLAILARRRLRTSH